MIIDVTTCVTNITCTRSRKCVKSGFGTLLYLIFENGRRSGANLTRLVSCRCHRWTLRRAFLSHSPCRRRLRRPGRICISRPLSCDTQASCHHLRHLRNLLKKRELIFLFKLKRPQNTSYSLMPNVKQVIGDISKNCDSMGFLQVTLW